MIPNIAAILASLVLLPFLGSCTLTQDEEPWLAAGLEVQAYPVGTITSAVVSPRLSDHSALNLRVGFNDTDRGDAGEQQDERGSGPGFGMGYRYYTRPGHTGWFLGGRVDLWFLSIDWANTTGPGAPSAGTTDVTVLQPTLEAGHAWRLAGRWRLEAFVAGGAELNVSTDGADVGEGGIGLLGLQLSYGF